MLRPVILRYGLLLGLAFCGYTTFMWLARLDSTYLRTGQYLDIAVLLLPITFIALALRKAAGHGRSLTLGQRIAVGLGVSLVATAIYQPYLAFYHTVINPGWLQFVLDLKATDLRAAGVAPAEIARQIEQQRVGTTELRGLVSALVMGVGVLGTLIPLAVWPLVRRRQLAAA